MTSALTRLRNEVAMKKINSGQAAIFTEVRDGLENLVSNFNTEMDPRAYSKFKDTRQLQLAGAREELTAMYKTNWLIGKIIDIIPKDMTREWRNFTSPDLEPEQIEEIVELEKHLKLRKYFREAHQWGRLYGTGFIVMNIDDGLNNPEAPLIIEKLKPGCIKHFKTIDRYYIDNNQVEPIQDPLNENFGRPEFYRIRNTNVKIHYTRLIRFDGVELPYEAYRRNAYNHGTFIDRLYDMILNFETVTNGTATMVHETNTDVVKVEGLMNYLQSPEGEAKVRKRFAMAKMLKSFNNMMLLDSKEEYQKNSNTFASLPELMDRYGLFLSAATDVPATRMLGSSASGLNATGEGDLKNYYDNISATQEADYAPKLDYLDRILEKHLGFEEDTIQYEFNSLFQMTPQETATLNKTRAETDNIYYNMGVLTESQIAKQLKQDGIYDNITDEDIEELEELEDLDEFTTDPSEPSDTPEQEIEEGEEEDSESDTDTEE